MWNCYRTLELFSSIDSIDSTTTAILVLSMMSRAPLLFWEGVHPGIDIANIPYIVIGACKKYSINIPIWVLELYVEWTNDKIMKKLE